MQETRRISSSLKIFNHQIVTMDDALQSLSLNTNCDFQLVWQCLRVLPADAKEWHDQRMEWDGYQGLYAQYLNPITKPLVHGYEGKVWMFMRSFQKFSKRPLDAIAVSPNCTAAMAKIFNVALITQYYKKLRQ